MYNLNTLEGKKNRIEDISRLIVKISEVPGDHLSYTEAHQIIEYLGEVKKDLEKQVAKAGKKDHNTDKKYQYYLKDWDVYIYANSGNEAHEHVKSLNLGDYCGIIDLTVLSTGEVCQLTPMFYKVTD